jgi:hypothetical protein
MEIGFTGIDEDPQAFLTQRYQQAERGAEWYPYDSKTVSFTGPAVFNDSAKIFSAIPPRYTGQLTAASSLGLPDESISLGSQRKWCQGCSDLRQASQLSRITQQERWYQDHTM